MGEYYLYRHIRLDTDEPFYIGIGKSASFGRAYQKSHRNIFWNRIINKTKYEVEILFDNLTEKEACEKEIWWIGFYGRRDLNKGPLVNLTDGGEGVKGRFVTEENRINCSNAQKKRFKDPIERERSRQYNLGKKLSEETKKKMSLNNKKTMLGKDFSSEHRRKIGEASKGREVSEESRKKMSDSQRGKSKPYNFIPTDEYRKKLSDSIKEFWRKRKLIEKV